MIFFSELLTLVLLLVIFLQDLWYRAVHWIFFPSLAITFVAIQLLKNQSISEVLFKAVPNVCFLVLVFTLLTLYFSWKQGKVILLTDKWIGLADILFLVAVAFYLPVLNFIFFYTASLLFTMLSWLLYQKITPNKSEHIPLAGFQSLLFIVFLTGDWWYFHINLNDDYWLYSHIFPWIQHNR